VGGQGRHGKLSSQCPSLHAAHACGHPGRPTCEHNGNFVRTAPRRRPRLAALLAPSSPLVCLLPSHRCAAAAAATAVACRMRLCRAHHPGPAVDYFEAQRQRLAAHIAGLARLCGHINPLPPPPGWAGQGSRAGTACSEGGVCCSRRWQSAWVARQQLAPRRRTQAGRQAGKRADRVSSKLRSHAARQADPPSPGLAPGGESSSSHRLLGPRLEGVVGRRGGDGIEVAIHGADQQIKPADRRQQD
jgi:hypothetical protein